MFSLTAKVGPSMGKSQNPGVARPLLFSPMELVSAHNAVRAIEPSASRSVLGVDALGRGAS